MREHGDILENCGESVESEIAGDDHSDDHLRRSGEALSDRFDQKDFYSVIVMVLTFYFGAQSAKKEGEGQ